MLISRFSVAMVDLWTIESNCFYVCVCVCALVVSAKCQNMNIKTDTMNFFIFNSKSAFRHSYIIKFKKKHTSLKLDGYAVACSSVVNVALTRIVGLTSLEVKLRWQFLVNIMQNPWDWPHAKTLYIPKRIVAGRQLYIVGPCRCQLCASFSYHC